MIRTFLYFLLIYFLVSGCQSYHTSSLPEAEKGIIDLRNWNLSDNGPIKLTGEWDFIWVDTLENRAQNTYIQVPSSWNNHLIGNKKIKGQGTAIYQLKILLNPKYKGKVLSLRLPIISTSANITINSKTVFTAGSKSTPEYKPDVVPFILNDSVVKLTIVVHNYYHNKGGLRYPIQLGLLSDVHHLRDIAIATDFWLIGAILLMACYHMGLFLIRKQNKATLYFSIFCFLIVIRVLVTGEYSIRYFIPLDWLVLKRIEYLVFYFPFLVFSLFIKTLFPGLFHKIAFNLILYSILISVLLVLFTSSIFFTSYIEYFYPIGGLMMVYGLFVVIQATRTRATGSLAFLIGYIAVFLTYFNDVLYAKGYLNTGDLISVGLFIFLLGQALLLLQHFSQAFIDLEKANTELSDKNTIIELQNHELQELNHELDNFVHRTSHDLRAPIASVMGLINIAQKETDLTKIQEYLELKNKTLKKLDRIIRDTLDFSKNKRLQIEPTPIDFQTLFQEIIENHLFMEHAEVIEKLTEYDITHEFYSDQKRLEIILNNLVSNAIKYYDPTKEKPYIKLSVVIDKYNAQITIADNGVGIGIEHHTKIFDMFYQVGNHPNSTGVGLYVVKDALTKIGGSIAVESKLGTGTTFHIKIPNLAAQS